MNPLRAVREKCLDCTCQQPIEVKGVHSEDLCLIPIPYGGQPIPYQAGNDTRGTGEGHSQFSHGESERSEGMPAVDVQDCQLVKKAKQRFIIMGKPNSRKTSSFPTFPAPGWSVDALGRSIRPSSHPVPT